MVVKISERLKLAEYWNVVRGESAWTKVKYFWRTGWIEIPVIMTATFVGLTGVALTCYTMWYGCTHDMTPKYYRTIRILRADDPEVKNIRYTSTYDL